MCVKVPDAVRLQTILIFTTRQMITAFFCAAYFCSFFCAASFFLQLFLCFKLISAPFSALQAFFSGKSLQALARQAAVPCPAVVNLPSSASPQSKHCNPPIQSNSGISQLEPLSPEYGGNLRRGKIGIQTGVLIFTSPGWPSISASSTDLKRIQLETPQSFICDFGGDKTFMQQSSSLSPTLRQLPPCRSSESGHHHTGRLPKALPEDNQRFSCKNNAWALGATL